MSLGHARASLRSPGAAGVVGGYTTDACGAGGIPP